MDTFACTIRYRALCRLHDAPSFGPTKFFVFIAMKISSEIRFQRWLIGQIGAMYCIVNTGATGDSPRAIKCVFYICPASLNWGCFR